MAVRSIPKITIMPEWRSVPELVSARFAEAENVQKCIRDRVAQSLVIDPGLGYIYWQPETKEAQLALTDEHDVWQNILAGVPGISRVTVVDVPPSREEWIRIKRAADGSWMHAPYRWAGALTGGPTPMTNSLVSALLAGGLGYGAGTALEHLLPEQYVERGKLRKTLGLMGAGLGAVPGLIQAGANHNIMQDPSVWGALTTPDSKIKLTPDVINRQAFHNATKGADEKLAYSTGLDQSVPVPVDAFNRAIWNDVHNGLRSSMQTPYGTRSPFGAHDAPIHTPPHVAAATSGLVTGIQQMYGNTPLLSPMHFVKGLAAAGTDMITARVAGSVLGALGGLRPQAQEKLQQMGLWSGLIRGVAGSVLGVQ